MARAVGKGLISLLNQHSWQNKLLHLYQLNTKAWWFWLFMCWSLGVPYLWEVLLPVKKFPVNQRTILAYNCMAWGDTTCSSLDASYSQYLRGSWEINIGKQLINDKPLPNLQLFSYAKFHLLQSDGFAVCLSLLFPGYSCIQGTHEQILLWKNKILLCLCLVASSSPLLREFAEYCSIYSEATTDSIFTNQV